MMKKSFTIIKRTLSIIGLILLIYAFYYAIQINQKKDKLLAEFGKETYCVVSKKYKGAKRKKYIVCYFTAKNKGYKSHHRVNSSDWWDIQIGDTLKLIYYPEDPEINELNTKPDINIKAITPQGYPTKESKTQE
ncbi:MAG TPA: hypothetical protein P5514_11455 [Bacteroidales bacterium]|nr:hypothetical protein [Bacteroidales bacterium]HRX97554.1 hypothetical protein [Bacteroidales bacterium]